MNKDFSIEHIIYLNLSYFNMGPYLTTPKREKEIENGENAKLYDFITIRKLNRFWLRWITDILEDDKLKLIYFTQHLKSIKYYIDS